MICTSLRQDPRLLGCYVRCSGHIIQPKGISFSQQARGRGQICVDSGVSSEALKLTVIQINWVRTDTTNKLDTEFYLQLICFPKH